MKAALYTGDPGANGTSNEVSGGNPAYARKTIAWNAADGGNINLDGTAAFDVPGSTTIKAVGFWSSDGAAFYGAHVKDEADWETFSNQGIYTLTDADLNLNA